MYEHYKQPLANDKIFMRRLAGNAAIAAVIILISLAIGILGYHFFENLPWVDALLNASMILGGMGPVNTMQTTAGKIFASFYALYSGIVLIATVAVLAVPIVHRFMHQFHLQVEDNG
jgi:ABC-type glycerol-3-phosphate transport system permease component